MVRWIFGGTKIDKFINEYVCYNYMSPVECKQRKEDLGNCYMFYVSVKKLYKRFTWSLE